MDKLPKNDCLSPGSSRRNFLQALIAGVGSCWLPSALAESRPASTRPVERVLTVSGGRIAGVPAPTRGVAAYLGIPYAAPPVGGLRWKPPQPVVPWPGIRQADRMGASPFSPPTDKNSVYFEPSTPMNEDCLTLNVWVPQVKPVEPLPVMVWIYGGDWIYGNSSDPLYWGDALASRGVIVVSINYRIGVLGFLAHPQLSAESDHGVSGNYGLLDQIAALQWVRDNIAHFGGDPGKVTVFGQSAGSFSVNYLMASPLSAGLFHRAIGQSGAAMGAISPLFRVDTLAHQEDAGQALAKILKADSLEALRALPPAALMNAGPIAGNVCPVVDGWLLPDRPQAVFAAGRQHPVPLLTGFNENEGTVFPAFGGGTLRGLHDVLKSFYGDQAALAESLYPANNAEQATSQGHALFGDQAIKWGTAAWAGMHQRTSGQPVYFYHFAHPPGLPPGHRYREGRPHALGVFHGAEIPYVMGTLPASGWINRRSDHLLSERMASAWVQFARTGHPGSQRSPLWPVFDLAKPTVMEFGKRNNRLVELPRRQQLELISRVNNLPL